MSNFQIRTRTWSKLDSKSDHENTRYILRTRMGIKKRLQKTLATKDTHINSKSDHENTHYSSWTRMRIKKRLQKTLATNDTHISKSTKSCTKLLTQKCIRKKVHENTNYNPRTLIQINKHAQTHSLKWTYTNKPISAGFNSCLMSNFQIRTRTWSKLDSKSDHENTRYSSRTRMRIKKHLQKTLATKDTHISKSKKSCTKVLTQKCIRKKVHENTNYNPRTLIQINKHAQTHSLKRTCTNVHVKKHAQKCIRNNVLKNTKYNTRTLIRITKQQQEH
ncbi:hypothetical protein MIMGU_mgv11b020741mg [Erythranthe guttata]|uniref:Uncharacterized protein n=1 Tax=Erythranthe guttata TaxID=4155 RepID=A0A022R226_ERYGU|nr:hypothetical protein MIMGU_mgv11b020741mg [Erythranthe guttata]